MADNYWTGAVSTNWNTAGNWSLAAAPVPADDVYIFDGPAITTGPGGGTLQGANKLNSLQVGPDYPYNIMGSGGGLNVDADAIYYAGSGAEFWLTPTNTTTLLIVESASRGANAVVQTGGTITTVIVLTGRFVLAAGATATTIHHVHRNNPLTDALVDLVATSTVTTYNQRGGQCMAAAAPTTINLDGGEFTQTAGGPTTVNVRGGVYHWDSEANITTINGFGGRLDATRNMRAKTLTTLNPFDGFTADLRSGGGGIIVTNENAYGGVVMRDRVLSRAASRK